MPLPGEVLAGRYRVVAPIGRGGMGSVYRAHDFVLDQPVALEFIAGRASRDAVERLTHEVRIGRRVTHPNVCHLHDIVEAGGERRDSRSTPSRRSSSPDSSPATTRPTPLPRQGSSRSGSARRPRRQ